MYKDLYITHIDIFTKERSDEARSRNRNLASPFDRAHMKRRCCFSEDGKEMYKDL